MRSGRLALIVFAMPSVVPIGTVDSTMMRFPGSKTGIIDSIAANTNLKSEWWFSLKGVATAIMNISDFTGLGAGDNFPD